MGMYFFGELITAENAKAKFIDFYSALPDYRNLTEQQKRRFSRLLDKFEDTIKGTPSQRWRIIRAIFYSFIAGIKEQNA